MKLLYKHIIKTTICTLAIFSTVSCNDSFMERYPETDITEVAFFKTVTDLEVYVNGLYSPLGASYDDARTDNSSHVEEGGIHNKMTGTLTPINVGRWEEDLEYWRGIRSINFMLARTDNVTGDAKQINHFIGVARLFRAIRYYNLVKRYSNVPWYDKDLQTTDTEELFKTQDSRVFVVDKIMEDIDFAVNNINDGSSNTKIVKNIALGVQARIALHEGTYRKYHTYLNLSDGDKYLNIAVDACELIINSGKFEISTAPNGTIPAYETIFKNLNLTQNKEMIYIRDYDKALNVLHNAHATFNYNTGMSKDLMEDYLVLEDGKTKYFHSVPNYESKTFLEVFKNRDPRLGQTIMMPGYVPPGYTDAHRVKLDQGGYAQVKFHPTTYDQLSWGLSYTDLPIIRYAEVLLNYAEAKAELGTLTQTDIDIAIKPIRERVGMPAPTLAEWSVIDPVQEKRYKNVSGAQKGAILEIRRERRIELASEGFRYGDLMRWALGDLFAKSNEGVYIPNMGTHDITGDGKADIVIVKTQADLDAIPEADKEGTTAYILDASTCVIELTEGDKGYVRIKAQQNKYTFISPKHYYFPLDRDDIKINPNLKQTIYWE